MTATRLRRSLRLAIVPIALTAIALAGCAAKSGDAGSTEVPAGEAPADGAVQVIDATRSSRYSIEPAATIDGSTITIAVLVTEPTGERIAPSAAVWYEDGLSFECRPDSGTAPTLESERLEVQLVCPEPLRADQAAEITVLDDFDR